MIKGSTEKINAFQERKGDLDGASVHKAILFVSFFFLMGIISIGYGLITFEPLREYIGNLGWKGVLLYIPLFVLGSFLFSSATALSVIAPALFGPWLGFAAILAGNMVAEASMFSVTRWAGSHWQIFKKVQVNIPKPLIQFAEGKGLLVVFYARLMLFPASVVNYSASLLPISFSESFFGTLLGIFPHCLATALSVGILRDAFLEGTLISFFRWEVGLMVLVYSVTFFAVYRIRKRMMA
ncbi:MAG TPA: VTT domain-containing protein [Nitrospiria bacterium]|jgi:uncharacterized membrane protein YdjX (TVP38/TMEM64 family)